MKHEIFFSNIKNVGNLYLDYVLFEFENEPLLFTCVDSNNKLYFCHCYKLIYEQKWFVVPISIDKLKKLLSGNMDIRTIILSSSFVLDITRSANGEEESRWTSVDNVCEKDLPLSGTLVECDKGDATSYINKKLL